MSSEIVHLYRIEMAQQVCPSGLKAKALLQRKHIAFEDHVFKSRGEIDAFKLKHDVQTTPQIWIGERRIGGFEALQTELGEHKTTQLAEKSYTPVFALFAMTALMAMSAGYALDGNILSVKVAEWFIAFSMCVLSLQKIRDLNAFSDQFLTYDLLALKWHPYAKIYPFFEGGAGILMIAGALNFVSIPVAITIGGVGAVSVFKAVYMDKRDLNCACVGGNSNVPLGFLSLIENIMMVLMAVWMFLKI